MNRSSSRNTGSTARTARRRPLTRTLVALAAASAVALGTTACGVSAPAAALPEQAAPEAVVVTDSGPVRGRVAEDHRSFQGIPYAAPPVGPLRWRSPQPPARWTEVRDATTPGPACAQPPGVPMGRPSRSEDCLLVNVTTPVRTGGERLPVMVWLHGGSLVYGAGDVYGAEALATRGDVVVVSVNYRLGALGFLAHPAFDDGQERSGNFGLEDQQAALRWVRRNIAAFGGDPRNVTLFGQSAGSFSICAHLAAPGSAGLFDKAIMQSGPCTAGWTEATTSSPRPRRVAERDGLALAASLGCADAATAGDCLRAKPVADLLQATGRSGDPGPALGGPVLPVDPAQALASGDFHRVPVIHGFNRDEERLRVWGMEVSGANCGDGAAGLPDRPTECPLTAERYRRELDRLFGADATRVAAEYPVGDFPSPSEALGAVLTDSVWARSALDTAAALARHTPTYAYEFADERAPFFTGARQPSFPLGAFHTAELPYLFRVDYTQPLTDAQARLGAELIGYWTRFAHTGDPNGGGTDGGDGVEERRPRWSPFRGQRVLSLASEEITELDAGGPHHYDFWRSLDR